VSVRRVDDHRRAVALDDDLDLARLVQGSKLTSA
jgi:hypothetical protein